MYKGTNPTCHDFNLVSMTPESVSLVIGFSTGQIQLIDPIKKELSKLYNEEVSFLKFSAHGNHLDFLFLMQLLKFTTEINLFNMQLLKNIILTF